jgi:hypothetical protein
MSQNANQPSPLQLASIKELVDELSSRCDSCVIGLWSPTDKGDFRTFQTGHVIGRLGLVRVLSLEAESILALPGKGEAS